VGPRRALGDRLEHQQLGAVQVRDDRDARRHARGRLVDRRQVVQVQDVGVRRARVGQRLRPRVDVLGVDVVVDGREDAIGGPGPVLIGRMQRRVARVEVDRADVEALKEGARVAVAAGSGPLGAGHERHVPAVGGELGGQRSCYVRRATTGKEHEG
jgi:hypothetical protein